MALRDNYTRAALAYYDARRRELIIKYGQDRVEDWESLIESLLATRTGHLPPLEALLLMSDAFAQGELRESQHHAREVTAGIYSAVLPMVTEPGLYTINFEIASPARLRITSIERSADA